MLTLYTVGMVFAGKYLFEKHYHISATQDILTLNSFDVQRYHGVYDLELYMKNQKSKWKNTSSVRSRKLSKGKSHLKSDLSLQDTVKDFNDNSCQHKGVEDGDAVANNRKSTPDVTNNNNDLSIRDVNYVNNVNTKIKTKNDKTESSLIQANENEFDENDEISSYDENKNNGKVQNSRSPKTKPKCIF